MDPDKLPGDQLADELVKIHESVAQSDATDREHQSLRVEPSTSKDSNHSLPAALGARVASARKVIELLHHVRPATSASTDTVKTETTQNVVGGEGQNTGAATKASSDIPTSIGRFEIRSLLGNGGFGLVFQAYDPDLDREVAVKVPTFDSLIKSDALARFHQEGRVVAALSHPNIVPVFEVGNDGPISFIASEYIAGQDLSKWVAEHGPLPARNAAAVIAKLADAIQHAHDRDVIHRDLKPANILVDQETDSENCGGTITPDSLRITDFGLAKMVGEQEATLTQTDNQLGTPAYAAPEQLANGLGKNPVGKNEQVDVYSLGATLFFLLTGSPPFSAENLLQLLRQVETRSPKLPSHVPTDLAAICYKALKKSPSGRYASAYEFGKDLHSFLDGRPIKARQATWIESSMKTVRRNPLIASLVAATLLSVVVGSAVAFWSARQARIAARETRQQYLESKQVIDDYYVRVSRDPIFMSAAFKDEKIRMLESAKRYFSEFLADNEGDEALRVDLIRTRVYIAYAELAGDDLPGARTELNKSLNELDSLLCEEADWVDQEHLRALCLVGLGTIADKTGDYDLAFEQLDNAIEIYESLLPDNRNDQPFIFDLTQAYRSLYRHYRGKGEAAKAEEYSLRQEVLLESSSGIRQSDPVLENFYAMVLGDRSLYFRDQGKPERSLEMLDRSIEISENLMENQPNPVWYSETAAATFYRRGVLQVRMGNFNSALADAKRSLQLFESLALYNRTADLQDLKMSARNLLAVCFEATGQRSKTLALSRENLADARMLVEKHPDQLEFQITLITKLFQLASGLTDYGKLSEAESLGNELAIRLEEMKKAGVRHPMVGSILIANQNQLGRILHRRQEYEAAIEKYDVAEKLATEELESEPNRPDLLGVLQSVHDNRSYSYLKLGNHDQAISDRRISMKIDRFSPAYQNLALAELLASSGQIQETRELLTKLDIEVSRKELSAAVFDMKMAVVHGLVAAQLEAASKADFQNSDSLKLFENELQLAESHFLKAVDLGYFHNRSDRYKSLKKRSDLELLLDLPSIRKILERQALVWEQIQNE